jgi:hypothetical protein
MCEKVQDNSFRHLHRLFHSALTFSESRAKLATEVASVEDSLRAAPFFRSKSGFLDGMLGKRYRLFELKVVFEKYS